MNRISRFLARPLALSVLGLSLLLGVSGCASTARVGVNTDFDHSVNFRTYKTWAWYPQQPTDTEGGPAQGYQSFLDKRIRAAVERELAQKGLTFTDKNPDVYVAYSARVEDKQRANPGAFGGYPFWYGYGGWYGRGLPPVTDYKAGTVIIDLVDARRKELAWRGQGQAQLDEQTISETEVHRIVNSILGNYPPHDQQARR
ncbi:DUF4136 domain-containing protein [Hymenobacter weizhouensis]|uniref:DUF4136 domain-containing protein n=1 Tax=Hymenobacter sp. YIM 151500-1 TaxID=2987689 RepID=UPI0022276983|nr:DUF4136 domain-containing protein [Hymenobacter sp. YIM 151500-1]UYZ62580.1 DUF4136 domain-containing protein [Hymenobacter sp. YIM 151500-1]